MIAVATSTALVGEDPGDVMAVKILPQVAQFLARTRAVKISLQVVQFFGKDPGSVMAVKILPQEAQFWQGPGLSRYHYR